MDHLQHNEQTVEEAKQQKDKTKQKAAEGAAKKERGALLHATRFPSAIYYFLAATQFADETAWRTEWQENNQYVECLREDLRSYYQESFEAPKPNMDLFPVYS